MLSIGKKIKELRTEHHLTQEELAKKIGSTRSTIANWEIDRAMPDVYTLILISDLFQISIDQLLERHAYSASPNRPMQVAEPSSMFVHSKPSPRHQEILAALILEIGTYVKGFTAKLYPAPFDVWLPIQQAETRTMMVQPDLTIICDTTKVGESGYQGSPDWIIEIISPATLKQDMTDKVKLYAASGVKEYWVVHPQDETVFVFTLQGKKAYGQYVLYTGEEQIPVSIFKDLSICLANIFK